MRCSGTKMSLAIRQLLPVDFIPATNQVSSRSRSVRGIRARPWSTTSPASSVMGMPSTAQSACQEPEFQYHRPVTRYPPSTLRASAVGASTPETSASGWSFHTSSWACLG